MAFSRSLPLSSRPLHPAPYVAPKVAIRSPGGRLLARRHSALPPEEPAGAEPPNQVLRDTDEELALVSFHIPVASPRTDTNDVVVCPDFRDQLVPRDSPLLRHDNFGGGFVDDGDRVALNTLHLSSITSSGATDMCFDLPDLASLPLSPLPGADGSSPASSTDGPTPRQPVAPHVGAVSHGIVHMGPQPDTPPPQQQHMAASREPAGHAAAVAAAAAAEAAKAAHGKREARLFSGRHLHNVSAVADRLCVALPSWAVRAGPRKQIFFDPTRVNAAIVTCGHICPGVNDVVQALVHRLTDYGVPEGQVLGVCDGFSGFDPRHPAKPRPLTRLAVEGAHLLGGSMLGTSKSWADIDAVVHKVEMWDINMLFVVGGDGGLRAAQLITEQCAARGLPCCVVGVPKSIENDILLVDRTFGFETAVQEVQRPLLAAKVEASSIRGGIGLVKVMGRHSGFLAMQASLASGVVDVCLIPEVSFTMDGPHGLLAYLATVLECKGHAVVCVAEGAGQDLIRGLDPSGHGATTLAKDPLGNPVLHDIGVYLRTRLKLHFKGAADVRYIDPTYMIRATPCNSMDHIYARILGHNAVDAAFSGFTGVTVGMCNNHYVLLPIPLVIQAPRRVDPWGKAWNRLREDTGQPSFHPPPALGRIALSSLSDSEADAGAEASAAVTGSSSASVTSSAASLASASVGDAEAVESGAGPGAVAVFQGSTPGGVDAESEVVAAAGAELFGLQPPSREVVTPAGCVGSTASGAGGGGFLTNPAAAAVVGTAPGVAPAGAAVVPSDRPGITTVTEALTAELPWPSPPTPPPQASSTAAAPQSQRPDGGGGVEAAPVSGGGASGDLAAGVQPDDVAAPSGNNLPFREGSGDNEGSGVAAPSSSAEPDTPRSSDERSENSGGGGGGNGGAGNGGGGGGAIRALGSMLRGMAGGDGGAACSGGGAPESRAQPHRRQRRGRRSGRQESGDESE